MYQDTDLTLVLQIESDTEVSGVVFDDDPTPIAVTAFDDTEPVVIPAPVQARPRAVPPPLPRSIPRRARFHRVVKPQK